MVRFSRKKPMDDPISINVGATFDIPTGTPVIGRNGETIMNGGIGRFTGMAGRENSYKSTIMQHMLLTGLSRVNYTAPAWAHLHDTELTVRKSRINDLARNVGNLPEDIGIDQSEEALYAITKASEYKGIDYWVSEMKELIEAKRKDNESVTTYTCLTDPQDKSKPLKALTPSFVFIDSITEAVPEATYDMLDKSKKDDSSTNMFYMKGGLYKTKFLGQLPHMSESGNIFFFLTAHIGDSFEMSVGPGGPAKKMQYLPATDKIKGVPSKFTFLTTVLWLTYPAKLLADKNDRTKPLYPLDNKVDIDSTHDLNIIRVVNIRNKFGETGTNLEIIASQAEGVFPTLTEFHMIKENNRFGLEGNNTTYNLILRPEVKITRTTIRRLIDTDPLLCRAINITSELYQLLIHKRNYLDRVGILCTPKELYEGIIAQGYDWDILLNSRGWWTPDNYNTEIPYLHTIDLLKMRVGLYEPYWYKKEDRKQPDGKL